MQLRDHNLWEFGKRRPGPTLDDIYEPAAPPPPPPPPKEDLQTETVTGAAAFEAGRKMYVGSTSPARLRPRPSRHPADPAYVEPPDEGDEDE